MDYPAGAAGTGSSPSPPSIPCVNSFLQDCWVSTWPTPRIPIALDSALSADETLLVSQAIAGWTASPMPENFLQFSTSAPGKPLRFSDREGCGVQSVRQNEVQFALAGCRTAADVERELGVALGIPRAEQRIDRDGYLILAGPSAFTCTDAANGDVYSRCDDKRGAVVDLGSFDFNSVTMGSAISLARTGCELAPTGARLFRRRAGGSQSTTGCVGDVPIPSAVSERDKATLIELFSLNKGWTGFRAIKQPGFPAGLNPVGDPAVVSLGGGDMRVLTFASDGKLYQLGYDIGPGWGNWEAMNPTAPAGSQNAVGAVSSTRDSWLPDGQHGAPRLALAVVANGTVFALGAHVSPESAWINLGSPPGGASSPPAVAALLPSTLDVVAVAADGQLWFTEWDGNQWSTWGTPCELPRGVTLIDQPAAFGSSVTGELVIVARASDTSLWVLSRDADQQWGTWLQIGAPLGSGVGGPAVVGFGLAGLRVFVRGDDGFLWQQTFDGLTWSAFEPLGGMLASRPSADSTIAFGTDLTAAMIAPSSGQSEIWARHLPAP